MFSRSRSPLSTLLLLFLGTILVLGPAGCASTKARDHWWQFWRPKKIASVSPYDVDRMILPPPPGAPGPLASDPNRPGGFGVGDNIKAPPPPLADLMIAADTAGRATGEGRSASELTTVYFGFDSYDLDPQAKSALDQNMRWIAAHPGIEIQIEGHCDERGTIEYNLLLGERRAKSVKAYLVSRGVQEHSLKTISYGKERPIDPTHTDVAFSKNRRAQFLVY